jgi:hypothetical protein
MTTGTYIDHGSRLTPTGDYVSPDELRRKAAVMEAEAFDFLDERGEIPRNKGAFVTFRVTFIDGTVMLLSRSQEPQFRTIQFKLRPVKADA